MIASSSLDRMPFEIFQRIISEFDLKERLKLRLVSKLWNIWIDLDFERLFISNSNKFHCKLLLRQMKLNIRQLDQGFIQFRSSSNFESAIKKCNSTLFRNLKRLDIAAFESYNRTKIDRVSKSVFKYLRKGYLSDRLNLSERNSSFFTTLSLLEGIECLNMSFVFLEEHVMRISLMNLKSISIDQIRTRKLILETPRLKRMKIYQEKEKMFDLQLVYADCVEQIELNEYGGCFLYAKKLSSLKYLYCDNIEAIETDFLSDLTGLRELHFSSPTDNLTVLDTIIDQKHRYNLVELKINFCGLYVESRNEFEKCVKRSLQEGNTNFCYNLLIQNYEFSVREYRKTRNINYSEIEENWPNIPNDFISKFKNLIAIRTSERVKNESLFFEFIDRIPDFTTFIIQGELHSQTLLNRLALHCPSIQHIRLINIAHPQNSNDLNFILEFKQLIYLQIDTEVDVTFIEKIHNSQIFMSFIFIHKGVHYKSSRLPTLFELSKRDQINSAIKFTNLSNMIKFIRTKI